MITIREIQQNARNAGVRDQQIEKDYVLSWILRAVSLQAQLSKTLAFKGGTVLKKVYFDAYRFSEDLDFTLLQSNITNDQMLDWFSELFDFVQSAANIPLAVVNVNEHEDVGLNFYISYTGPLGGQGNNKKVKIDISRSERLVYEPEMRPVLIGYSDLEKHQLLCYSLEEVLIEKMRTVMQRMQARDFYDLWFLLEQHKMDIAFHIEAFALKCIGKHLKHTDFPKKLEERLPQYKGRWENSMKEQIRDLPDFDKVHREVQRHLKRIIW